MSASPAGAQFFFKNPDLRGAPVRGDEPGMLQPALPGATQAEIRAAMVWSLRVALNVSALQCQFQPMLLSVPTYNAFLTDHQEELKQSLTTLNSYFTRMKKTKIAGQRALDEYGTKIYSAFSTVSAQYIFCLTASDVGHDALFTKRGGLHLLAQNRMRELKSALRPAGEQYFPGRLGMAFNYRMPRLDDACWSRGDYQVRACGPVRWEQYASGLAQPKQLVSL
ncbi:hypothetical protein [Sphingomonas sp.]|uniref:hypothetical protein n=1 Tax=Sphingomonas sp. TaxID=28214 RepID=UPI0025DBD394|nr:hypothetical protein [Sphingomonas sp.]